MDLRELAPPFLIESSHGPVLRYLYELYGVLDARISEWQRSSGLACPPGCGQCCARYEPFVLAAEGMAVAAFVAHRSPAGLGVLEAAGEAEPARCVFYDGDTPLHCTVHPARPLECRLFGFSASRAKNGRPLFRLCRDMPGPQSGTLDEEALRRTYGTLPPLMPDFGARLGALAGAATRPLREQARAAWRAMLLLGRLRNAASP